MEKAAAKLVRARPKLREYLPEWAKCCEDYMEATQSIGQIVIDVSTLHDEFFEGCGFCHKRMPGPRKRVMDVADGMYVSFDTFDLDEGFLTEGEAEHAQG